MNEYQNLVHWLTAPFDTGQPMWKLILTFVIFVILGFIVVDNLDVFQKGLKVPTP